LIQSNVPISSKIWIYGNGVFAQRLAKSFTTLGFEILGYLEINEKFRSNSRLVSSNPLEKNSKLPKEFSVILGIGNGEADIKNIATKLKNEGFDLVYPLAAIRFLFLEGIKMENYWMSGDFEIFDRCREDIESAQEKLADSKSKKIFHNILEFRKTGNPFTLVDYDPKEQTYLPNDLPWISKNEILNNVIDAGAYDGDTLRAFHQAEIKIDNWWCFEPDMQNLKKLQENLRHLERKISVTTIPCALWSKTEMLAFETGGDIGTGSAISNSGKEMILATSLDEIRDWENCSLIKMDIEGAELDALKGSIETITKTRPKLAISVYHKPTDLWEIIGYLEKNLKNYSFYLRTYCEQTFETVLYGVPK
jgi:FkbM family methyltransferase